MSVQQQVLSFQVPVYNVAVVAIFHCRENLPELAAGFRFTQPSVFGQIVCKTEVRIKSVTSKVSNIQCPARVKMIKQNLNFFYLLTAGYTIET